MGKSLSTLSEKCKACPRVDKCDYKRMELCALAELPPKMCAVAGGGREVIMNVNARRDTKMVFGAKKQSEIILNKGTNMKITGVHFDGSTAYPRNGRAKPRVVIDVETF